MNKTKITIEALISADVKKVWDYYTKPEHITEWNFASDDWHCPKVENDLRVGGKFKSRMEAKDGSFGFDFEGSYTEVVEHRLIGYAFGDRSAQVRFDEVDGHTRVTVTFDPEDSHSLEQQEEGWKAILENFKKHVERFRT